jgi:CheY-like chemotaxis protein
MKDAIVLIKSSMNNEKLIRELNTCTDNSLDENELLEYRGPSALLQKFSRNNDTTVAVSRPALPAIFNTPGFWKFPKHLKSGGGERQTPEPGKHGKVTRREYPGINRIMLAEDDQDDGDFFSHSLSTLSADVRLAIVGDGHELMTTLKRSDVLPDVVFLDVNMPRKNGYECIAEIRADNRLNRLPVVIISTSGDRETIDRFYELGASAFIAKPKDFNSWAVLIDKVLARKWSSPRIHRNEFVIVA